MMTEGLYLFMLYCFEAALVRSGRIIFVTRIKGAVIPFTLFPSSIILSPYHHLEHLLKKIVRWLQSIIDCPLFVECSQQTLRGSQSPKKPIRLIPISVMNDIKIGPPYAVYMVFQFAIPPPDSNALCTGITKIAI